jgi:hypothetical protein
LQEETLFSGELRRHAEGTLLGHGGRAATMVQRPLAVDGGLADRIGIGKEAEGV